jgi:hypothetical protein
LPPHWSHSHSWEPPPEHWPLGWGAGVGPGTGAGLGWGVGLVLGLGCGTGAGEGLGPGEVGGRHCQYLRGGRRSSCKLQQLMLRAVSVVLKCIVVFKSSWDVHATASACHASICRWPHSHHKLACSAS